MCTRHVNQDEAPSWIDVSRWRYFSHYLSWPAATVLGRAGLASGRESPRRQVLSAARRS
jgi:hypothetical protein